MLEDWIAQDLCRQVRFQNVLDVFYILREPLQHDKQLLQRSGETLSWRHVTPCGSVKLPVATSTRRSVSLQFMRQLHYEFPEWCEYVDLAIEKYCQPLMNYLLTLRDSNGAAVWAKVWGYEDYIIHRSGSLMLCSRRNPIRVPWQGNTGYSHFSLECGHGKVQYSVHRMVWEAFHQKPIPKDLTIDHIDRNPQNNDVANLRLASASEQLQNQQRTSSNRHWPVEVKPPGGDWISFSSKAEAMKQFPIKQWKRLLLDPNAKTAEGIHVRYKAIDPRVDREGKSEVWYPLPGTAYFVSSLPADMFHLALPEHGEVIQGRNARLSRLTKGGIRIPVDFALTPGGYSKLHGTSIHRLVYEAFHGPIPSGCDIDHIDGDPSNNYIQNLQALSRKEHALKTHGMPVTVDGTWYPSIRHAAEACQMSASTLEKHLRHKRHTDRFCYADENQPVTKRRKL